MQHLLNLSRDEVLILTDRVQNTDVGTDEQHMEPYALLLKLASAYLEAVTVDGPRGPELPVAITEAEAWLLRAKVSSNDRTATDPLFGVRLLRKIYQVLLDFNSPLDDMETVDGREEEKAVVTARLEDWRRTQNGGTGANNPDDGTTDGATAATRAGADVKPLDESSCGL